MVDNEVEKSFKFCAENMESILGWKLGPYSPL